VDRTSGLAPRNTAYLTNRAAAYTMRKMYKEALDDCLAALDIEPDNAKVCQGGQRIGAGAKLMAAGQVSLTRDGGRCDARPWRVPPRATSSSAGSAMRDDSAIVPWPLTRRTRRRLRM